MSAQLQSENALSWFLLIPRPKESLQGASTVSLSVQLESQVSLYDAATISMQLKAAHTTHRGSTTNAKNIFWWSIHASPEQLKEVVATWFFLSDGFILEIWNRAVFVNRGKGSSDLGKNGFEKMLLKCKFMSHGNYILFCIWHFCWDGSLQNTLQCMCQQFPLKISQDHLEHASTHSPLLCISTCICICICMCQQFPLPISHFHLKHSSTHGP